MPRTRRNPARLTSLQKTALPDPPEAQTSAIPTVARGKSQRTKSLAVKGVPASSKGGKAISSIAPATEGGGTPSPRYNLRPRKVNQLGKKGPEVQTVKAQAAPVPKKTRERQATKDNRKSIEASGRSAKPSSRSRTAAKDDRLPNGDLHKQDLDGPLENSPERIPTNTYPLPENVSIPSYRWSEANDGFVSGFEILGYQVPDSESMRGSTRGTTPNTSATQKDKAKSVGPQDGFDFEGTLKARGVILAPARDAEKELVKRIEAQNDYTTNPDEEDEWKHDQTKSIKGCEAIFQHTIMIAAIDRHNLGDLLNYTCEAAWLSPLMPVKPGWMVRPTTKPKPDLSVGFERAALIDEVDLEELDQLCLSSYMLPEGDRVEQECRAFPFFIMEVKGSSSNLRGVESTRQCLNSASHALFNMWKFFEGEEIEQEFFDKARVFSTSGDGGSFKFRIHWAFKAKNSRPGDPPLVFRHQELELISGDAYRKDNIVGRVKNILHYGTQDLLPVLQKAVQLQLDNLRIKNAQAQTAADQVANDAASSSTTKKRGNHSPNRSGEPRANINKRQAVDPARSFDSASSTVRRFDSTHLGSDQSVTGVAV